jgi:4-diphosphocytidyl-2-C-methyl-D-erythritol kinase
MLKRLAPAKVNLSLRILGRRSDGFHQLEGLVAFAAHGDLLRLEPAAAAQSAVALRIDGPFGPSLAGEDPASNLIVRAARLHAEATGEPVGGVFHLTKHLPVASGVGGGSSDAAAALLLLQALTRAPIGDADLRRLARSLGADVPMCLTPSAQYVSGIGEVRTPLAFERPLPALLVNPGVAVATGAVFRELAAGPLQGDPAPRLPALPQPLAPAALIDWLRGEANDLEAPAVRLAPVIGTVLAALRATAGCRLARMSGSGATCFALYDDEVAAQAAAATVAGGHRDWWVQASQLQ